MQFQPKTEDQLEQEEKERAANLLWQPGEYPFEILEKCSFAFTEDTHSDKGNEMIKVVLQIWNKEGESRLIIDYLLEAMMFKLRHAAYACGLGEKYESGALSAYDFVGKQGVVKIKIDKGKKGYADKNGVADYIVPEAGQIQATQAATAKAAPAELDDEIPF